MLGDEPGAGKGNIIVTGEARAPGGVPAERWLAELQVGPVYKAVQVTGPRQWRHRAITGWEPGGMVATRRVPLLYEHAFGGECPIEDHEQRDVWWPNPVGCGFVGRRKWDKDQVYPVPQLLAREDYISGPPGKHYQTANFGPVPGDWAPRVKRIGTTDEDWCVHVAPHLPQDFDLHYFNCAPDDQQAKGYLRGNEEVAMAGLFENVRSFHLPNFMATALMVDHDGIVLALEMDLSTVHIDTTGSTLALVWRLTTVAARWDQISLSVMER